MREVRYPPRLGTKGYIDLKPSYVFNRRQPYSLSELDKARLACLMAKEDVEGQLIRLGPNDSPPPCATPAFHVDEKGSHLVRRVSACQYFNEGPSDYCRLVSDLEKIFARTTGKLVHTVMGCAEEFLGLEFVENAKALPTDWKAGPSFAVFANKEKAKESREWFINAVLERCG